jgi:predicted membrane protein
MADEPHVFIRKNDRVIFEKSLSGSRVTGRVVFGLILCILGFLWTLDSLDIVESEPILDWWPMVLVLFGLSRLMGIGTRRHLAVGAIFTFAGMWLLLRQFDVVQVGLFDLWPLILFGVGAMLVWNSLRRTAPGGAMAGDVSGDPGALGGMRSGTEPADSISTVAIWSGAQHKIISQAFRGGEITAVMGGADLDCRAARLENGRAVIDLFVWWGGVEFKVPEDWQVVNEGFVIMGAIEDKSKAQPAGPVQTLVLRGMVVMGGVEIKN